MELILQAAADALGELPVQIALPETAASRVRTPVIALSLRRCESQGSCTYLGMDTTDEREWYAYRMQAELLAQVHATSAEDSAEMAEQTAWAWLAGVEGMSLTQVCTTAPQYDKNLACFVSEVTAQASAWVHAAASEDGTYFEEFRLYGHLNS